MNNELKNTANSVLKLIEDGEKISLQLFANKLAKASNSYPEDHTIGMMAGVVARMSGNKLFISRAEVKELYKRLYSRNTKFASLFADELGEIVKIAEPVKYNREYDDETGLIIDKAYEKLVDPVLANALHNAFGNKITPYSDIAAKTAKELCTRGLSEFGAIVEVATGREDVIVCRASFDTPKGKTSVFIPVEVIGGKVIAPNVFIGNAGPEDLTRENVNNYIVANVGKKLTVSDSLVLAAVSNIKDGDLSKLSNVDLALTKFNATKEAPADLSQGQVLYQKTYETTKEVSTPGYTVDPTFVEQFDTALGIACYKFTNGKVKLGRDILSRHLTGYGFTNHQISVYDSNKDTIFYAIALDGGKVAFRVPVRIQDGKMLAPTMLISNGGIDAFSQESIKNLRVKDTDHQSAAAASPLFIKKASELVEIVRIAAEQKDYATAEEALNILATSDDDKAYGIAFECYTNAMGGVKVSESKCSHIVQNATSKHDLCSHTGLPLHKVYQDASGNCLPLYRKSMETSYEGASFMNNKIFF